MQLPYKILVEAKVSSQTSCLLLGRRNVRIVKTLICLPSYYLECDLCLDEYGLEYIESESVQQNWRSQVNTFAFEV